MATVNNEYRVIDNNDDSIISVTWESITTSNADGNWVQIPDYPDKTVQIVGNFGTGGTLDIEGSNDGVNASTLTDTRGNTVSRTAAYLGMIAENPRYIRPKLSSGTGAVDLDIIVVARRNYRGR